MFYIFWFHPDQIVRVSWTVLTTPHLQGLSSRSFVLAQLGIYVLGPGLVFGRQ